MVYCGILGICLPLARGMGRCAGKQHQEVLRTMQCTEKYFEADAFRTRAESVLLAAVPDSRTGGGLLALEGTVWKWKRNRFAGRRKALR